MYSAAVFRKHFMIMCILMSLFVSSVGAVDTQNLSDTSSHMPVVIETIPTTTTSVEPDLPVINTPPNLAPVNPAYLRFLKQKQAVDTLSSVSTTSLETGKPVSSHATGAIPLYEDISYLKGPYVVDDYGLSSSVGTDQMTVFPARYDLRALGRVSPIKDQDTAGVCWAFATVASLESTLLPGEAWDFSENNLKDLLSNLYPEGFDRNFDAGGNHKQSTAYLARWTGPINQSDDPYNPSSSYSPTNKTVQKHVQRVDYIPDRLSATDNSNIKTAVQAFGAVYTTYNMSDSTTLPYWNETHNSYYYFGDAGLNHAVAIVGWDDGWSRYNFTTTPPGDGAFIIKNSWGSAWGDGGYFYCSYYDKLIGRDNALFLSAPPTNYDTIYQYDPLGWVTSLYTASEKVGYGANVFTSTKRQNLSAVSFYTTDTNANYEVRVYWNPNNGPVLNSSGAVFTQTGTFPNAGYHTIAIPQEIPLRSNDRFAVAIKLTNPTYDWSIPLEDWTYRTTKAKAYPGQGYISGDGNTWTDLTDESWAKNASICIKAFTKDTSTTGPVASFTGTPTSGTAPLTVQFTDTSTGSPTGWAYFFGDEKYTAPWTQVNASAGWSARFSHTSVAMPDGSIVIMGGGGGSQKNDVWRSTDTGTTWTQMTAGAGWAGRYFHTSVAMPNGSIVLMGGYTNSAQNDVWISTNNGATWTQLPNAGWSARYGHTSVLLPDGSIILMGGYTDSRTYLNDVWRSTDSGATWTQVNTSAGWTARYGHSSVVMPDGSIVVMGGYDGNSLKNDVWRSTDKGATWTQVTASSGWSARYRHTSVAMPDCSIVLMGGADGHARNDVWRSTNNGATWTQVNASAGWSGRFRFSSVAMQDGSVVVMGGQAEFGEANNNVWRFVPVGSSAKNPSHTYTTQGNYTVTLQAYNSVGCNSTRRTGYITVTEPPALAANFAGTPTTGSAPLTVQFTDTSTGSPTGWAYFFGDEKYTAPWTQVNASAGWAARDGHSSVAMPNDTIVLMGGYDGSYKNDVWRSMDTGTTWTQVNASAGWSARDDLTSVMMPDHSIVIMGGQSSSGYQNDVWRSTDSGSTWTQMTASAGWAVRKGHSSVVLPDGSIVLMGGKSGGNNLNDTWRSTDSGATWTLVNASSGWSTRESHSCVAMPDGSIILMGGFANTVKNDVWRSTDKGATWTQMTPSAGWAARYLHSSVAMPDGSIVLMGGAASGIKNDVWRSTNNGATWTQLPNAGWSARSSQSSVTMLDGSIVLMGGRAEYSTEMNDVWRVVPTGSVAQSPSHTYTAAGMYSVTLTATNAAGSNTKTKIGYIVVTGRPADHARMILPTASLYQNTATMIPIRVSNITGGTGIAFNLTYDPSVIQVNEISLNQSYTSGSNLAVNQTAGLIRVSLTNTGGLTIGSPVPVFLINTTSTRAVGSQTSLNISGALWSDGTFNPRQFDTTNGSALVYRIRGDLNGNAVVDIGDTSWTAYMVVGKTPDLIPDADFNNNGRIDVGDASKIAYFLVQRIMEL